jgi:hypothetical protein
MQWTKTFENALIEKDINTIDNLLNIIPDFNSIEEMREAYKLIGSVKQKFEEKQLVIQQRMNRMQHAS